MKVFGNVEVYFDDNEIIEVLHKLPKMEECGNVSVLKFIQDETVKADFGTVIFFENFVYTVYKFDKYLVKKEEDAGLILTISNVESTLQQLEIWKAFRESGMDFSEKIFMLFDNYLSATHFIENYFFNKQIKNNRMHNI
jgi:hypothetical protein